jgi:uncharacterized membrane protein
MLTLFALVLAFGIIHAGPSNAAVKTWMKGLLGRAYGPLYGTISLAFLLAMIWAYRKADPGFVYDVPAWGRYANFVLSLAGFVCLGIFLFRGSWRRAMRYPMAIGVGLWAAGHLLANGDGRSLVFFGGLALAAAAQVALTAASGGPPTTEAREGHNLLSVVAGVAVYGIMTQLHYAVTGMPLVELGP